MPKILKVRTVEYGKLIVDASDGTRYHSDLLGLSQRNNFPDEQQWKRVKIDSYGIALVWPTHFQLHLGQIAGHAVKTESI